MTKTICVASLLALVTLVAPAAAEDKWVERVTTSRSDETSIKVIEPDGYKATVTVGSEVFTDTVPAKFRLPSTDNFYLVTVTAPSGKKWEKKLEAKRFQTTEVRISHTVETQETKPTTAPKTQVRSFIGTATNKIATCGKSMMSKFEFIDGAGELRATLEVKPGKFGQVSLPQGSYDVRAYTTGGSVWTYQTTARAEVGADNWNAVLMCDKTKVLVQFTAQ